MTEHNLTDDALIRRLRAGDDQAFDVITTRYRPSLVRSAERLLGARRAFAEDVVQDGLLRAYRALLADEREVFLPAWLHRIVRNRALDELRRPRILALDRTLAAEERMTSDDAAEVAQRREHLRLIVGDIATLPTRQREALVGHVLEGMPQAQLALSLGATVPATKNLISRARTSLLASERERAAVRAPLAA